MQTREWTNVDKSLWGEGIWQTEPDKVQWTDDATSLPCLAVRGPHGGWCGYVGVSEGHPLFGVNYDACPQGCDEQSWCSHSPGSVLEVHGGITFSDFCAAEGKEHGICHIPDEGEPDNVYWLGFDCAHAGDLSPAYKRYSPGPTLDRYRALEYVKGECGRLARQLAR